MKTFSEVDNFFMINLACIFGDSRRPPPPTQKCPLPKIDFIDVSDDFKLFLDFEKSSFFFLFDFGFGDEPNSILTSQS